jgi:prepilin-type N-terminal cleavage/methylation domain-containing protein
MVILPNKISRNGFTIVELLIVTVVIAILATISIVAYRGIQDRARAAEVSAGLTQARKKLELFKVDAGNYPTTGNLANAGVTNGDVSYQYTSDGSAYCLTGTVGTTSYKASNTDSPQQGGCAGHGQGGEAAITNLSPNPSLETNSGGWSLVDASGSVSSFGRDTSQGYAGSASAQFTYQTIGTNTGYPRWMIGGQAAGQPAGSYTISAWVKGPNGSYLLLCPAIDGTTKTCSAPLILSSAEWRQVSVTVTSTGTGTLSSYLRPVGSSGSTTSGTLGTYSVDAVMLISGTSGYTYADGNSQNWIWNGTPNNSSSTGPAL